MRAFYIPSCGNFLRLDVFETGCSVWFFFFLFFRIAEGILWTLRFLWRKVAWETFSSFLFELPYTYRSVSGMGCLTWLFLKAYRNWTLLIPFPCSKWQYCFGSLCKIGCWGTRSLSASRRSGFLPSNKNLVGPAWREKRRTLNNCSLILDLIQSSNV